ncbi:hypothetical protein QTP70_015316 [Hemibagrus guttatus]|uniref:branched-chain-amino-acid transaminase n=1 Tax=Hemibagrus guttatus TaxID=175788 RepID=A0AAE0QGI1_9TELE|nr:hypothetical protein QTP70_015316 [Hemibagrus guttatus]
MQGEFKVTERTVVMPELMEALNGGRVLEVFGAGTACVVCPVGSLRYKGQDYEIPTMKNGPELATRFYKELTDLQYGRTKRDWAPVIVPRLDAAFLQSPPRETRVLQTVRFPTFHAVASFRLALGVGTKKF